jgi:hypothetical protein
VRALFLAFALAFGASAFAQDKPPAPKKKPAAKQPVAHKKATPEQIRKFNELEKKKKSPEAKK